MSVDLESRLDKLEAEVGLLGKELAQLRALVGEERSHASAPPTAEAPPAVAPAPPPSRPAPAPTPPTLELPPVVPKPSPKPSPKPPPKPPKPPRRTPGELARDWDLVGARGFAIVGGAVMALGIGLFFVLAANRGWIGEQARVALGATASSLVFGAGLLLRARYGQYWSALAAVGAGIAGAYATLAAAAARYDLVPDGLALPLAGVIAAAGTVVAIRWSSQVIAAIGLLGAALAPALQALDTDMTWESGAFAVIVLVAVAAVAVPRGWRELLVSASVIVGAQVEWLAAEPPPVSAGTVVVASAFALALLGIACGRQIVSSRTELDPIALGYALASFGVTLALATQLFDERADRGIALLAASAVWAVVFVALHRKRLPDLAVVVGSSALALAAVGTADLLSDSALTLAWAAQAILLAALARRLGDARLQAMGVVYAALATVHVLATDGRLAFLFDEAADHLAAVLPLAAAAAAATATGVLAPTAYVARTESGPLAFVAGLRGALANSRRGFRETAIFSGAALATIAASFALVSASFEWGHLVATTLAAAVGAVILGLAGRLRSDGLAAAAYTWLGTVLAVALGFDAPEFYVDVTEHSSGGWAVVGSAAGLLGGAYAHRVAWTGTRARDVILGVSAVIAAVAAMIGISLLTTDDLRGGIGLLAVAVVYGGLAAGIFARASCRNASTVLWSLGLVFLVGAELALVSSSVLRTVVVAATALAVGALAAPLRESRLWLAGASLVIGTSVVVLLAQVQPWLDEGELELRLAIASAAVSLAAFALAALVWYQPRRRELSTAVWGTGVLSLLATERVLFDDWRAIAFAVALTGAGLGLLARPLGEARLWVMGAVVSGWTTVAVLATFTPPSHFFVASEAPGDGLWVLVGCVLALTALAASVPIEDAPDVPFMEGYRAHVAPVLAAGAGGVALYAVSLFILEVAERVSTASVETDFERGHTAVSAIWALVGLTLLVLGLLRGSAAIRYGGLALFGLSLAKIFLFDLAELSSIARAFSFILVGGLLLAGGFFLQRLSDRIGPRSPEPAPGGPGSD